MARRTHPVAKAAEPVQEKVVEAELEDNSFRPVDIPQDVWLLIQENGKLATERLNSILGSPKFMRLRAGDQAKLIALAQDRAYGKARTNNSNAASNKRRGGAGDVTATELGNLVSRAALPEYKQSRQAVEEAEIVVSTHKNH